MWSNNETTQSWDLEKMLEAVKKFDRIRAEHEMKQAELNLNLLGDPCSVCGHRPRLEGGIANGAIFVCPHRLEWMREHLPKADRVAASPFANPILSGGLDGSLRIEVEGESTSEATS